MVLAIIIYQVKFRHVWALACHIRFFIIIIFFNLANSIAICFTLPFIDVKNVDPKTKKRYKTRFL